jgi:Fe-S-cluster containining protein
MGIKPVELYMEEEDGKPAVGVRINDDQASVQDLLDAWQPLCDDATVFKQFAPGNYSVCRGCQVNCCNTAYVMPDLIAFKKMAAAVDCSSSEFVAQYMQEDKIDSGLLYLKLPCTFLNNNICGIYEQRSLICRFYICTDIIGFTQQLIYSITLTGIAATRVWAEQQGLIKGSGGHGQSSFDLMFNRLLEEYRHHEQVKLFLAAPDYNAIPVAPFLTSRS